MIEAIKPAKEDEFKELERSLDDHIRLNAQAFGEMREHLDTVDEQLGWYDRKLTGLKEQNELLANKVMILQDTVGMLRNALIIALIGALVVYTSNLLSHMGIL